MQLQKSITFLVVFVLTSSTITAQEKKSAAQCEDCIDHYILLPNENPQKDLEAINDLKFKIESHISNFIKNLNTDKNLRDQFVKNPILVLKNNGLHKYTHSVSFSIPSWAIDDITEFPYFIEKECVEWAYKRICIKEIETIQGYRKCIAYHNIKFCTDWKFKITSEE